MKRISFNYRSAATVLTIYDDTIDYHILYVFETQDLILIEIPKKIFNNKQIFSHHLEIRRRNMTASEFDYACGSD